MTDVHTHIATQKNHGWSFLKTVSRELWSHTEPHSYIHLVGVDVGKAMPGLKERTIGMAFHVPAFLPILCPSWVWSAAWRMLPS